MTNPLGRLVVGIGSVVVTIIDFIYNTVSSVINFTYDTTRKIMENVFYTIAKLVDKKGIEANEQKLELHVQHMELQLLSSASKVRDHANNSDGWTDHHTEAINAVGQALVEECDWDEEDVHTYLKSIVESVDGLSYDRFPPNENGML